MASKIVKFSEKTFEKINDKKIQIKHGVQSANELVVLAVEKLIKEK